ncbi:MAG: hypothetical protein EA379_04695 [Phycisphaerales bacterium]|nr:MAG: hypothetical protein EA379_04695 [Phycisphaerales bacterium]
MRRILRDRSGQSTLEYAMGIVALALVGMAAASLLSQRSANVISITSSVQPGAHPTDYSTLVPAPLVEITDVSGQVVIDLEQITNRTGTSRLGTNFGVDDDFTSLVIIP